MQVNLWRSVVKLSAILLLAATLLTACASLIGPRQIELPLTRLQESLEHRFPVKQRVLGVFEIALSTPQLALLPENNRVAIALEVTVASPLSRQSWHGNLALSGRLGLDAVGSAVIINEASLDRFVVDGVDDAKQRQFAAAVNVLSDQLIKNLPLYRFRPEELRFAGVQFVPTSLVTTPNSLVVTFAPH